MGGEVDIAELEILRALAELSDKAVSLNIIVAVALENALVSEDVDVDALLDRRGELGGGFVEAIGVVGGHVGVQRITHGEGVDDDVEQDDGGDDEYGQGGSERSGLSIL